MSNDAVDLLLRESGVDLLQPCKQGALTLPVSFDICGLSVSLVAKFLSNNLQGEDFDVQRDDRSSAPSK